LSPAISIRLLPALRGLVSGIPGLVLAIALGLVVAPVCEAAKGDCAQPLSSGSGPNATDCSFVLKASVGTATCEICVCDVNGNDSLSTTDALLCLKRAVGQSVNLNCPPCEGGTTTTTIDNGTVSTTSTSTTSTTTTIPLRCEDNADCSTLPIEFRCNPNTETCEKPCTRTAHCKDFYECNKITQYCEEPALLF